MASRAIVTLTELDDAGNYVKVVVDGADLADENNRQMLTRFYKKQTAYRTRDVIRMIRTDLIRDIEFEVDEPNPPRERQQTVLERNRAMQRRRAGHHIPDLEDAEEVEPEDEDEEDEDEDELP